MRRIIPKISLAAKCQLLFAAAVLLIIAATLLVPWVQMGSLRQEAIKRRAEQIAIAARLTVDLEGQDWVAAQEQLAQIWPLYAQRTGLPAAPPRLIRVETMAAGRLLGVRGFVADAVGSLQNRHDQRFVWRFSTDDHGAPILKLAMAVRASATEQQPGALRGIIEVRVPADPALGSWNQVVMALAGASGGFLAVLIFYLITQRLILSPVRQLRTTAEQVASGDLQVRSVIRTRDEFEELGDAFNNMLVNLERTQNELRTINKSLDVRLGELAETNVALYESNRLKNEFLANVSHELRTPLSSIIGFADLLRETAENPSADQRRILRYAENILGSGRMLLDIINDLLDLAKIEAGKLELHVTDFSVEEVCQALMDFVRPLADKQGLTIECDVAPRLPPFHSDSGRIKQVLYNLLSNAIKFTPAGGRVTLSARQIDDEHVALAVVDTGEGIAREKLDLIFEKFSQIDSSVTRAYGGTGLGLAITRELTEILGGEVRVASEVGKGSSFTVVLPLQAPDKVERPLIRLT